MDPDSSPLESAKLKASALHALVSGPLSSSAAKLFGRSRGIPSEKDFHFYNNFPDFKIPAREIAAQSSSLLTSIGSSDHLWGTKPPPPLPDDLDDAYDWLVSLNDDLFERFGVSMDEFKNTREKEEATGVRMEADGFTLVCGKKKKKESAAAAAESEIIGYAATGVKMASKDKKTTAARAKVPFHIPTIPRPQQEYNILVNNSNRPFEHVWLEKSDDGSRFVHPLEKLSVEDFVDRIVGEEEPQKPLPVESSSFKFVDSVKELKDLAAKLRNVKEFAVDLEHNQYRSFQGMTCLMQISTRTEDFIIDTLKLRVHVGPHLREVFKDPSKRKVMHGADRDMLWLQRDFGIYVCNLFDTGQASRVMQLERNSLEYLLHHFCEVNANKEYQTADWRLRPLPEEMLKYAREDTHYLLHIYDLMKSRLLSASSSENDLLLEVYKRSYEVCMQLYEKELLTDTSYLFIYGLQEADFDSKQLAIVYGLCEWRDKIAREEDESTGYILPNKSLLEIARQIPLSPGKLRRLVRSKHPHVERHINTVISIIRSAVENSSYFESISEQLKKARFESAPQDAEDDNAESLPGFEDPMLSSTGQRDDLDASTGSVSTMQSIQNVTTSKVIMDVDSRQTTNNAAVDQFALARRSQHVDKSETTQLSGNEFSAKLSSTAAEIEKEKMDNGIANSLGSAKKVSLASVQIAKKPTSAFGALLGNSFSRRKLNPDNGVTIEQDKNVSVVEQIKSSVSLPFHSFSGREEPFESSLKAPIIDPQPEPAKSYPSQPSETDQLEEIISLESGLEDAEASGEGSVAADGQKHRKWFPRSTENGRGKDIQPESTMEESPMSLSDLSSSFQECFQSINERRGASKQSHRPNQESRSSPMFEPFDYASARNTMNFGGVEKDGEAHGDDKHGTLPDGREKQKGGNAQGRRYSEERTGGFQQPRRRQAFPQSGNRSSSYM